MTAKLALTGLTVDAARRALGRQFAQAGLPSPELDARLLVGGVLSLDLTGLVAAGARRFGEAEAERLREFAQRRLAHEPVARILGEAEFWGLRFALSPATLVPRPETETVVEAALCFARERAAMTEAPLRIADAGTGSGAILLALLSELPEARGVGTDIAPAALSVASANAESLGLDARANFVVSDYLSALDGPFDLIVANPPYIRSHEIERLAPDVRDFEPRTALDGGADGLAAYRVSSAQSRRMLSRGGALIVEVGYDQAQDVAGLMGAEGLEVLRPFRCDLAGIARVVESRQMQEPEGRESSR